MSQLKYRISIGKVVDGELKHDHYATPEELIELRVNTDGKVEKYTRGFINETDSIPADAKIIHNTWDEYYYWQDVSDTHRVEWGIQVGINRIHENDILFHNKQPSYQRRMYDIEEIIYEMTEGSFNARDVIGNIHENPELLEVGE